MKPFLFVGGCCLLVAVYFERMVSRRLSLMESTADGADVGNRYEKICVIYGEIFKLSHCFFVVARHEEIGGF